MNNHPNATAGGYSAAAALLLVYLLHTYAHTELSIYYAGLIVGGAAAVVLFIGRRGIKGALQGLWLGLDSVWKGQSTKK